MNTTNAKSVEQAVFMYFVVCVCVHARATIKEIEDVNLRASKRNMGWAWEKKEKGEMMELCLNF